MKSKQTAFYSTFSDLDPILRDIEKLFEIQYVQMGIFSSKEIKNYKSIFLAPDLGYAKYGDWNYVDSYLILPKDTTLRIRNVHQKNGIMKYAVDQMENLQSLTFKMGGIYTEKKDILVAGRIATIWENDFSDKVFKMFSSKIKKYFKKIDSFYVGKEANDMLLSGWRLVTNEKLASGFDLKS